MSRASASSSRISSDVAKRNGTEAMSRRRAIPVDRPEPGRRGRYALFEHMIANHDWSMRAGPAGKECCHNAELDRPAGARARDPDPLRLRFFGPLNAPYATPPASFDINDVRQRMYRGYCIHKRTRRRRRGRSRPAAANPRGALSSPGLEPATQQRAAAYLEEFFADIATDADAASKSSIAASTSSLLRVRHDRSDANRVGSVAGS